MACFDGTITSSSLGMDVNLRVLMPEGVSEPAGTVYLLHGLYANYTCWTRYTKLELYANNMKFAVVMPDAGRSFYSDMPNGARYFTYVTEELPAIIRSMFNISAKRQDTFIAGLSMGGYGALKAALSYPLKYAAAASFSAVCDIMAPRMDLVMGERKELQALWESDEARKDAHLHNLIAPSKEKLDKANEDLPVLMTCGTEDYLLESNRIFQNMLGGRIPCDYREWPGGHEWTFWDKSIEEALKFFNNIRRKK